MTKYPIGNHKRRYGTYCELICSAEGGLIRCLFSFAIKLVIGQSEVDRFTVFRLLAGRGKLRIVGKMLVLN